MRNLSFFRALDSLRQASAKQACFRALLATLLPLSASLLLAEPAESLLPYVKPMVGTARPGQTIPAVGVPFGMTQLTPQTQVIERQGLAPYNYGDPTLAGFRVTHWISGSAMQDFGSVAVMPITGRLVTRLADFGVPLSHDKELSAPDYYQVKVDRYGVNAELTALARAGMMRFTCEKQDDFYLLIMPNSDRSKASIAVDASKREITGYNPAYRAYAGAGKPAGFNGYFVIQVDRSFESFGTFQDGTVSAEPTIGNKAKSGAYLGFKLKPGEQVGLRIGTSFTSIEAARRNLEKELAEKGFDEVRKESAAAWEKWLGKIRVTSDNAALKRIFYTAFYHCLQQPRLYNDAEGTYPMFSRQYQTAKLASGDYYDDFSMWDIFRAHLPLFEILEPELINTWIRSMVTKGQQGGWLDIFPCWNNFTSEMVGDHVLSLVSAAYLKGIRNYDVAEAYRLMRQNAFDTPPRDEYVDGKGRRALTSYLKYGYIPMEDPVREAFHREEQVSRTLEYAYDDYALAQMAKALNKTDDYEALTKRALNYRNVFDPSTKIVRGRHIDGSWYTPVDRDNKPVPFDPDSRRVPYITEGSSRQYTFFAPQDVQGLARLMGGDKGLEDALDTILDASSRRFDHTNETGHQIPFMYNYVGAPWKTQKEVRRLLEVQYHDGPRGLSGNDDAGQMSAWYLFGALGFYPVDPVSGEYPLCSPLFDKATIQLAEGKALEILMHRDTPKSVYIREVKRNGAPLAKNFITYADLMTGGKLEFTLQDEPNKNWGSAPETRPSSLSAPAAR